MLDPTDYKEPACPLCGGDFYNPSADAPSGTVPVGRIIDRLDGFLNRDDMDGAERHLEYWQKEAAELKDRRGELSIVSEMLGLYRKTGKKQKGLWAVEKSLELIKAVGVSHSVSGATVILNAATTMKAFGDAENALPLYSRAADIYEKELRKFDIRRAGLHNNRALAFVDLGRFEEAEKDYFSAIDILNAADGDMNDVAITYVNLAHLYENFNGAYSPKECMEKAVICLESPKIKQNSYHAYVCTKCAPSFEYFGFVKYAEKLKKRAEELYARY